MDADALLPSSSFWSTASETDDPFIKYIKTVRTSEEVTNEQNILNCEPSSTKVVKKNRRKTNTDINKIRTCSQCPFSTLYNSDLRRHLEKHKTNSFTCSQCNMPFLSVGHLNRHKEFAHGIKSISDKKVWKMCDICDYKTRHSSDVSRHRRRHEAALGSCKYCKRPFCHLGKLKEHMKREHGDTDTQSNSLKEKKHVFKETESVKETNDLSNYAVDDTDMVKECTSSFLKDGSIISKQIQDRKQSDISDSQRRNSDSNKRGRDKVKVKKKRKPSQIDTDKSDGNTEKPGDTEQDKDSVNEKTNKINDQNENRYEEDRNYDREDPRKMIKCAFCGLRVYTYNTLYQHLEEHDINEISNDINDIDSEQIEKECDTEDMSVDSTERSYLSESGVFGNDSETKTKLQEEEESTLNTSEIFFAQLANTETYTFLEMSTTDSDNILVEGNYDQCAINRNGTNVQYSDITEYNGELVQNDTNSNDKNDDSLEAESVDTDTNEFVDAVSILNGCVAKIESQSGDLSQMKPFACSKCFFTTGNLEYLKIHVEAHLFESTYEEQSQKWHKL